MDNLEKEFYDINSEIKVTPITLKGRGPKEKVKLMRQYLSRSTFNPNWLILLISLIEFLYESKVINDRWKLNWKIWLQPGKVLAVLRFILDLLKRI